MGVKKWSKAHRAKYQKTMAARTKATPAELNITDASEPPKKVKLNIVQASEAAEVPPADLPHEVVYHGAIYRFYKKIREVR